MEKADHSTFFKSRQHPFPLQENSKTRTKEFLEASEDMVVLVGKMGKAFAPARYDISCNIEKISKKFDESRLKYEYLEDMVLLERHGKEPPVATDALMWLRRGLDFMRKFLEHIVVDTERREDLSLHLEEAYKATIKQYHGWITRQLFKVIAKFTLSRKEVLTILALDNSEFDEAKVLEDVKVYTKNMGMCIDHLIRFYADNNLENHNVV